MAVLKNLLALIGLLAIIAIVLVGMKLTPYYSALQSFDNKALQTYEQMAIKLLKTGNAVDATTWKRQVKDGLSVEDVEDVMSSVATELNIKDVGQLPLSKQVELMTGEKQRFLKIYMYCNPLAAAKMVDYSDAFSAYLPCRLALVQDKRGKYWIYSLNMDMMIHGGEPLPPDLKKEAERVRKVILTIMDRAAKGEF